MREFIVIFLIRKGLGPEMVEKSISVGFDDIDPETPEYMLKEWAVAEAEKTLYNSFDFKDYGKNWTVHDIQTA